MALFDLALQKTLSTEGGYVNHPSDPGGETYKGIARAKNPHWSGWERIGSYRDSAAFPTVLDADSELQKRVAEFYFALYWSPVGAPMYGNQLLANEMFDIAVHTGVWKAVTFLQRGLNILNRQGTLYPDLVVDGAMGIRTLAALEAYEEVEGPGFLHKALVIQRGAFYIDLVEKRERSEAFIRGWLRRVVVR
jgi:lysozyme family protein